MIRNGLCSARWFPRWLLGLKAIVSFLRQSNSRGAVARRLREQHLDGAADLLENAKLPNFAEWRWGTLHDCCEELSGILGSLKACINAQHFVGSRDTASVTKMLSALQCDEWHFQFGFVRWFCAWLGRIMRWGQGCRCHDQQLSAGLQIECDRKGRRIPEAHGYATEALRRGLAEANAWTSATWGGGAALLTQCQAVVRATYHLSHRKIAHLDRIPYLLARLSEPGVRSRCIEQWNSCDPSQHHRVSHEFLSPSGELRALVDAVRDDGTNMSERLHREVESLAAIPLDDSVAEGPHARAHQQMRHATGARWPWIASSMRLKQNLEDAFSMPAALGVDLDTFWASYTTVLQGPTVRGGRMKPKKTRPRTFRQHMYAMTFMHESASKDKAPAMLAIAGEGKDDEGDELLALDEVGLAAGLAGNRPAPAPGGQKRKAADAADLADGAEGAQRPSLASIRERRQVASRNARSGASDNIISARRDPNGVRLMRQFLDVVLEPGCMISAPASGQEGEQSFQFFQVLALESRPVLVKTFAAEDEDSGQGLYEITVQPLERWGSEMDSEAMCQQDQCHDVFPVVDPCLTDVLAVCGGLENRHLWRRWQVGDSDVSGCLCLMQPAILQTTLALNSPKIPVLSLLDALHQQGFAGRDQGVLHQHANFKNYDERNIVAKRAYLQCVLAMQSILPKAGSFPSGEPQSFYMLLLRGRTVAPGQGAKEYKKQLLQLTGDVLELAALEAPPAASERLALPSALACPAIRGDASGASSVVGDEEPEADPSNAPDTLAPPLEEGEVVGDDGDADLQLDRRLAFAGAFPEQLLGQRLRQVQGRVGGHWNYLPRLSVTCRNPDHRHCSKSRSTRLGTEVHGDLAPVFFLGAWLERSELPEEQHKKYVPNNDAISAFASSYSRQA